MAGPYGQREWLQKSLAQQAQSPATLERPMKTGQQRSSLRVGVPKETALMENRVALSPRAVGVLVANGHEVYVEHLAGEGSQYTDGQYTENGAVLLYSPQEIYNRSDVVLKIAPLNEEEVGYVKPYQTIISAVHMGVVRADYLKRLMEKNVTAIGFEFIRAQDGSNPFMQMMSQIAGIASIQIAAELLAVNNGGVGQLLGGITGVPPVRVAVIGAGTVGRNATRTAMAMGAQVRVIDEEVHKLYELEQLLGSDVYTAINQPDLVAEAVAWADVVIGAAYIKGYRAPLVVTRDMISDMRPGSVVIDVAIDQGGCIETSRVMDHRHPTFVYEDVIHYCVPNIASRVARTGSEATSNILTPLILKLGKNGGVKNSLGKETSIQSGIYIYHKHITQRVLADLFGFDFMDIDLLYAADI
jgi:alanine dehydrogenase